MIPTFHLEPVASDGVFFERRSAARFPISCEARFRTVTGAPWTGTGRTIDMSSSGILFAADAPLRIGQQIEALVSWPANAAEGPVTLAVIGTVVRVEAGTLAFSILRYRFCAESPQAAGRRQVSGRFMAASSQRPRIGGRYALYH